MQHILVTGANGFIGKSLIEYLSSHGYMVRAMVRNPHSSNFSSSSVETFKGDMTDYNSLLHGTKGIDGIVHLAAAKSDEPDSYETNVTGAKNLLRAAKENNVQYIINISTAATKIKNKGQYASTKSAADTILMESGFPVTTIKPSVVYGDGKTGVFTSIMKFAALPITPVIGPGVFDFYPIHVEDLCVAIEKAMLHEDTRHKYYDVGGSDKISFNDLIKKTARVVLGKTYVLLFHIPTRAGLIVADVCALVFKKPPFSKSNILGSTQEIAFNIKPFMQEMGFIPRSLDKGLQDISYTENLNKEAALLYNYLSPNKEKVTQEEIERYGEALCANNLGLSYFSLIIYKIPFLLGWLDAISRICYPYSVLQKKILITTALTEASLRSVAWLPKQRNIIHILGRTLYLGAKALLKLMGGAMLFISPKFIDRNVGK